MKNQVEQIQKGKIKCPINIDTPDKQNSVIKIIRFPNLDILVFFIPYVIPRAKASILADSASKIHLIIIFNPPYK